MKYRKLGRTGLKVSELGIGGHEYRRWLNTRQFANEKVNTEKFSKTQPQRNKIIERLIDAGVNYFDTTLPEEEKSLGEALKSLGRREEVYIAAAKNFLFSQLEKTPPSKWTETITEAVGERLRLLQTDYVDIFNINMPENNYSQEKLETTIAILEKMREKGKIGAIGASSHEPVFIAELIRKYDCFDSIMVPYNYHLQKARDELFPLCKARNVGVVVMKPLAWPYYGLSFTLFCPKELETNQFTPAQSSFKWILKSPEVSTIVTAVNSVNELEENLDTFAKQGKINEEILNGCLRVALGPQGKDRLREMTKHLARDIQNYARKALNTEQYGWNVVRDPK